MKSGQPTLVERDALRRLRGRARPRELREVDRGGHRPQPLVEQVLVRAPERNLGLEEPVHGLDVLQAAQHEVAHHLDEARAELVFLDVREHLEEAADGHRGRHGEGDALQVAPHDFFDRLRDAELALGAEEPGLGARVLFEQVQHAHRVHFLVQLDQADFARERAEEGVVPEDRLLQFLAQEKALHLPVERAVLAHFEVEALAQLGARQRAEELAVVADEGDVAEGLFVDVDLDLGHGHLHARKAEALCGGLSARGALEIVLAAWSGYAQSAGPARRARRTCGTWPFRGRLRAGPKRRGARRRRPGPAP